jgi:hypothetical protein
MRRPLIVRCSFPSETSKPCRPTQLRTRTTGASAVGAASTLGAGGVSDSAEESVETNTLVSSGSNARQGYRQRWPPLEQPTFWPWKQLSRLATAALVVQRRIVASADNAAWAALNPRLKGLSRDEVEKLCSVLGVTGFSEVQVRSAAQAVWPALSTNVDQGSQSSPAAACIRPAQ